MATKRENELLAKVQELEKAHDNLMFDLDWQKRIVEKRFEYFRLGNRKNGNGKRGTQLRKVRGTKQAQETRKIAKDAFGQREGSQGFALNAFIIPLIERGRYSAINADTLTQMSGGQFSKGRVQGHLNWLKRKGLI